MRKVRKVRDSGMAPDATTEHNEEYEPGRRTVPMKTRRYNSDNHVAAQTETWTGRHGMTARPSDWQDSPDSTRRVRPDMV